MPANLTPQYLKAEEAYKAARNPEEKLACLEEMLRLIPKHKGTEKLQADIKRRIAALRKGEKGQGKASRHDPFRVERAGAGRLVLLGAPNTGKSSLLAAMTRARPEVSPAPFTTQLPVPGMMPFEDVQVQLLDLPPITSDYVPPGMMEAARNSDGILLLADLGSPDALEQAELALETCRSHKILLHPPLAPPPVPEDASPALRVRPGILLGTKADLPEAEETRAILEELLGESLPLLPVSAANGEGLETFREKAFRMLDVIRVYSKEPGKPPDRKSPFVLKRGATVLDLAERIHKDIAANFKFARVWGAVKHDGIQVARDHVLADRDVVEIHT